MISTQVRTSPPRAGVRKKPRPKEPRLDRTQCGRATDAGPRPGVGTTPPADDVTYARARGAALTGAEALVAEAPRRCRGGRPSLAYCFFFTRRHDEIKLCCGSCCGLDLCRAAAVRVAARSARDPRLQVASQSKFRRRRFNRFTDVMQAEVSARRRRNSGFYLTGRYATCRLAPAPTKAQASGL